MTTIGFTAIEEGRTYRTAGRTITDADIINFAGLSGDFNPLHTDDTFAAGTPYGRRIAHGLLGVAVTSGLRSELDDWYTLAFLETRRRFVGPVFPGDTIHARYTVTSKRRSQSKPDRGIVIMHVELVKQDGSIAQDGEDTVLIAELDGGEDQ